MNIQQMKGKVHDYILHLLKFGFIKKLFILNAKEFTFK